MSLQEIELSNIKSSQVGMARKIDESSERMMLDVLQISQYTKPVDATIRELASNAVDSQREKEVALEILEGKAKVEDYYIQRTEAKYRASNWDPTYFDLKYLDRNNNKVKITYKEGPGTGFSDELRIKDYGVGLGMPRLAGYFSLGYSTKRNSTSLMGAFGLGAKVALATRCDYYTINTAHNGKKYAFNCYSYKIDSIIPRFNETGDLNPSTVIDCNKDGTPAYSAHYAETTEKNYSEIVVPFKRHNRQRITQAVKTQLLYFNNVEFYYTSEEGYEENIRFKANILHNSSSVIVSDTNLYNRPHIVVVKDKEADTGVCYGAIDFGELEIQSMYGTVGFRCPVRSVVKNEETGQEEVVQAGISVSPSRESVIWDEFTRKFVLSVIEDAKEEATKLIQKELKETDFLKWVKKCSEVINRASNGYTTSVLSTLTRIIDINDVKPKYPKDDTIKYNPNPSEFFWGLKPKTISKKYNGEIDREDMSTWNNFNTSALYILEEDEKHSLAKDKYLYTLHNSPFLVFKKMSDEAVIKAIEEADFKGLDVNDKKHNKAFKRAVDKKIEVRDKIYKLLVSDVKKYSDVVVPANFLKKEEELEEEQKQRSLSPAEVRALQKRTVCYTYKRKDSGWNESEFRLEKVEPKLSELSEIKQVIYYNTSEQDHMMKAAAEFNSEKRRYKFSGPCMFDLEAACTPDKKLDYPLFLRFSKRNLPLIKYNKYFKPLDEYFYANSTDNMKTLGDYFIKFFTAKYINERLQKLKFFTNFRQINPDLSFIYEYLTKYVKNEYEAVVHSSLTHSTAFNGFGAYADKVIQFQMFKQTNEPNAEELKVKSVELFDTDDVTDAYGIDLSIVRLLEILEEFSENIYDLFNGIDYLTGKYNQRPSELKGKEENIERLIMGILAQEGLDKFTLDENTQKYILNLKQT